MGVGASRKPIDLLDGWTGISCGGPICKNDPLNKVRPNPDYENAPYEMHFWSTKPINFGPPPRFDKDGQPVFPYLWTGEKANP